MRKRNNYGNNNRKKRACAREIEGCGRFWPKEKPPPILYKMCYNSLPFFFFFFQILKTLLIWKLCKT